MERVSGLLGTMIAGVCPVLGSVVNNVAIDDAMYQTGILYYGHMRRLGL